MAVTAATWWRRMLLLLAAALVAAAMVAATATSAAFAGEKSEESCGASNPKIDSPAGPPFENKGNKGKEFEDCGFRNNPHGGPVGHEE
jgi:hypothetical protein